MEPGCGVARPLLVVTLVALIGLTGFLGVAAVRGALADRVEPRGAGLVVTDMRRYARLPLARSFGDGWRVARAPATERLSGSDRTVTVFWFAGPAGERVVVTLIPYGDRPGGREEAVAFAHGQVAADGANLVAEGYAARADLDGLPTPEGCSSVVRAEGLDNPTGYRVGLTACADDVAGQVVMVAVSGAIGPAGAPVAGARASDNVAAAVVSLATDPLAPGLPPAPLPA